MAQGKPPRHSKSSREPVTLDLKAEKDREPTTAKPAGQREGEPTDGQSKPDQKSETPKTEDIETTRKTEAKSDITSDKKTEAEKEQPADKQPQSADRSDRARSGHDGTTDRAAPSAAGNPASTRHHAPGIGYAVVAGFVGGVIATAIGLGLFYGDVLPVPGNQNLRQTQASLGVLDTKVTDLGQAVAALENEPKAQANDAQTLEDLEADIASLPNRVAALDKQTVQARTSTAGAMGVGDLDSALKTMQQTVDDSGSRLDALTKRVDGLASKVASAGNETSLVKAVAAAGLSSAIDRGGSFARELQAYRSVAPDDPAGATLQGMAAAGVPSRTQLLKEFPDAADAVLSAVVNSGQGGIFDRLMASARSVVKIRPTGDVKGNGPKAIVARMEVKLNEGDLAGVVKEWSMLPAAGQDASKAFILDVRTRLKARTLAEEIFKAATPATNNGKKQG